jgi:hypothetical protein
MALRRVAPALGPTAVRCDSLATAFPGLTPGATVFRPWRGLAIGLRQCLRLSLRQCGRNHCPLALPRAGALGYHLSPLAGLTQQKPVLGFAQDDG